MDENGKPTHVGEVTDWIRKKLEASRQELLADMVPGYPAIRRFFLGHTTEGRYHPPGKMMIECDGNCIVVRLEIPLFDLQCEFSGTSGTELLETLENSLDCETVNWRDGWRTRKLHRDKTAKMIRGAS